MVMIHFVPGFFTSNTFQFNHFATKNMSPPKMVGKIFLSISFGKVMETWPTRWGKKSYRDITPISNPRQTDLFPAMYRGYFNPLITIGSGLNPRKMPVH